MYKKRIAISLRFSDIDQAGHVHNAQYLNYFESGRIAFLSDFIPDAHDWESEGLILARNEIDYLSPIRLNDEVEIEVFCDHVGTKSFRLNYDIFTLRDEQQTLCCRGTSTMVCYNYHSKESMSIPPHWRKCLTERI